MYVPYSCEQKSRSDVVSANDALLSSLYSLQMFLNLWLHLALSSKPTPSATWSRKSPPIGM